jgi:hypothetical protein
LIQDRLEDSAHQVVLVPVRMNVKMQIAGMILNISICYQWFNFILHLSFIVARLILEIY